MTDVSYKKIRQQIEQISKIQSPVEREQWIKALAKNAHVSTKSIWQELHDFEKQIPDTDTNPIYTDDEKAQAIELLKNPNLINKYLSTCHTKYIGRDNELLLLKLATITRHFDMGLPLAVTGTSSVGKSELIKTVLKTVYPPDCEDFTRTSEQYLLYREKPLDHKIITFYEMHGAKSASYLLRTALSEGNLKLGTVISNSKVGIMPKDIEKSAKGLVILSTTTEQNLDPELETRLLKIEITHDEQLARKVYLLDSTNNEDVFKVWQCADSLIKPLTVEIPFEKALANLFSTKEERYLRDFKKVKLLIRASALFHQYQRPLLNDNCILATRDDYELIYSLRNLISQSVNVVGDHIIRFLEVAKDKTTREEIQTALNKSAGTIKRYVRTALEHEFIEISGRGSKQTIKVLEIPEPISALPSPKIIFDKKDAYRIGDPMIQIGQVVKKYNEKTDHSPMIHNDPMIHSYTFFGSSDQIGSNRGDPMQNSLNTAFAGNGSSDHEVYITKKSWTESILKELSEAEIEALEERIAVMEFEGGLSHKEAVQKAIRQKEVS
ncbi:MAG: hypothetical protein ACP5MB_08110 [bacterium]